MRFTRATSKATQAFWRRFNRLDPQTKKLAVGKYRLFLIDPQFVDFKKLEGKQGNYYSARISRDFRAAAEVAEGFVFWEWIGNHRDYDVYVRQLR